MDTTTTRTTDPPALTVDRLVDETPGDRNRTVDFLRALSIIVVILWHWVFSLIHPTEQGALTMPNPIGEVSGLWLLTWLLQIMPVFFIVGGYSNLTGWSGVERAGGGWALFARRRLGRLLKPIVVFVGIWVVGDVIARSLVPGYGGVLTWGLAVFVPLWFIAMYAAVALLAPLTIRAHRAAPVLTAVAMVAGVVLADLARFRFGLVGAGMATTALVWLFAHQLGYFWRDGSLHRQSRSTHAALAGGGLAALILATNIGVYPRSMVAVQGESISNMNPTTSTIAALALFQLGLILLVEPALSRWLSRRRPWKATVSVNAVIMTLFTWHMTALVGFLFAYQAVGGVLADQPTTSWWITRPLWLAGPAILLAGLMVVFARFELPQGRSRQNRSNPSNRPDDQPDNRVATVGSDDSAPPGTT